MIRALIVFAALSAANAYWPTNIYQTPWEANWRDVFLGNQWDKWGYGTFGRLGKRALFENELNILDPHTRALKRWERAGYLPRSDYLFDPTNFRQSDRLWETERLWEEIDERRVSKRSDFFDVIGMRKNPFLFTSWGRSDLLLDDLTTSPFEYGNVYDRPWDRFDTLGAWPETNRWQDRQLEKEIVREEILREQFNEPWGRQMW